MSITYSAGAGTIINSCASQGTTPSTDDDANTIILDNTLANNNNGQIGTKFTTYVGRVVAWDSTDYGWLYRLIVSETGTTQVTCTVNEPWPGIGPPSSAVYRVYYDIDDVETGGASGGITLNSKTGLYEFTNEVTLSTDAGLAINSGVGVELSDENNSPSFTISSFQGDRHWLIFGVPTGLGTAYDYNEKGVAGGVLTTVNATQGEPSLDISPNSSSAEVGFYGSTFWSQRNLQTAEIGGTIADSIFIRCTDDLTITLDTNNNQRIVRSQFIGNGTAAEIVTINSGVHQNVRKFFKNTIASVPTINLTSSSTSIPDFYHTLAIPNSTIELDVSTAGSSVDIAFIDPQFDLDDIVVTGSTNVAVIQGGDSIVAKVKDAVSPSDLSGTKIFQTQFLYNGAASVTRSNGIATGVVNIDTGTDTLDAYSINYFKQAGVINFNYTVLERDIRIGKYGRIPYIQRISTTGEPITLEVTLEEDPLIVEASATTARTTFDASATEDFTPIYWIIKSTNPSGSLAVLDSFTDANSTQFQVLELISSDGSLVLTERTSGSGTPTGSLSRVGGGWTATVDSSQQIGYLVDGGGTLSLQNVYDGIASNLTFNGGGLNPDATLLGFAGSKIAHPMSKDGAAWIGQEGQYNEYNGQVGDDAAFYAYNTTDTSETAWKNVGAVTFPQTFSLSVTGLLGNSEVRVYNNPSLLTGGGSSVEVGGVETVAAVTQVGNGSTNGVEYATDGANILVDITGQTTTATELVAGDKFRVIVRNNADNPTLQLFDEFEVSSISSNTIVTTTSDVGFTSVFGTVLNGNNFKIVTIEKVNASETFNLASGTYDIVVFRKGSLPEYFLERELAVNLSIPAKQVGDRVYNNPA